MNNMFEKWRRSEDGLYCFIHHDNGRVCCHSKSRTLNLVVEATKVTDARKHTVEVVHPSDVPQDLQQI